MVDMQGKSVPLVGDTKTTWEFVKEVCAEHGLDPHKVDRDGVSYLLPKGKLTQARGARARGVDYSSITAIVFYHPDRPGEVFVQPVTPAKVH